MSDLYIDFRPKNERPLDNVSRKMRYFEDMNVSIYNAEGYGVTSSRPDNIDIWGSCIAEGGDIYIALAGRLALDDVEWKIAKSVPAEGGLATRYIYSLYKKYGIECFKKLNGNYVVAIFDDLNKRCHVGIDRSGMCLAFMPVGQENSIALSSHPDLLASTVSGLDSFDYDSMAEFVAKGNVSFPNTYYKHIKALEYGAIYTFDYGQYPAQVADYQKYFEFSFSINQQETEWDCAERLSHGFQKSLNRRVNDVSGRTAVSLSGGLDSRTVLCSIKNKQNVFAFSFFDEQNLEFKTAKAIADKNKVDLAPLKRDFDFYGNAMEKGAAISGGMSNLNNNHFLGFRDYIVQNNVDTIIAGFYCDYLFKSLTIDKNKNKFTMLESLGDFKYQSYTPLYLDILSSEYGQSVQYRLDSQIPDELKKDESNEARLERAHRRIFPFYYEPDSSETTIPQRTMGWSLPIVDNDILDVYQTIPPQFKLNASVASKAAYLSCGDDLKQIMNTNTYMPVCSGPVRTSVGLNLKRLRKKIRAKNPKSLATDGSWPNRDYYIRNSIKVRSLFDETDNGSYPIINTILAVKVDNFDDLLIYQSEAIYRLLTLKIWIENRIK